MVSKWIANNPLTFHERKKIESAIAMGMSYSEMAVYVDRAKSTVMRESKRLGKPWEYNAKEAQQDFEYKQTIIGKKK